MSTTNACRLSANTCDTHGCPVHRPNEHTLVTAEELAEVERRARLEVVAFGRATADMVLMARLAADLQTLRTAVRTLLAHEHIEPVEGSTQSTVRTEDVARLREMVGGGR